MKNNTYLISFICYIFLLASFPLVGCHQQQSFVPAYVTKLNSLDSLIEIRPAFQSEKEDRILIAKKQLHRLDASSKERYQANKNLQTLYKGYICDSLLHYVYANIELAKRLHDSHQLLESQLTLAITLTRSGMYTEGLLIMNTINRATVSDDLLDLYYFAYHMIYREKSYITKDRVMAGDVFSPKAKLYQDSLISVIQPESPLYYEVFLRKYMDENKYDEALALSEDKLNTLPQTDRDRASVWYNIADVKNLKGDKNGFFESLVESAKIDMRHSIKDHASLHRISRTLYECNEISHAASYIQICMEDAYFYNANLRSLQLAKTLPVVTNAYEIKNQTYINNLHTRTLVIISLLVLCMIILMVIVVQKNKLSRMHKTLTITNKNLNALSNKLSETNTHLNEVNGLLIENNFIKENYIAHFIQLSSDYINKNDKYRLEINKLLRKGKTDDAIKLTLYNSSNESELEEFYSNFDNAFLSIFPNFIEEFNKLLIDEYKVTLYERKKENIVLTSELRVFALIRLGFHDSATIAEMLRYSINTIYNIRSKVKTKSLLPKDQFESSIMRIGAISPSL